jgi:hypothetical protein
MDPEAEFQNSLFLNKMFFVGFLPVSTARFVFFFLFEHLDPDPAAKLKCGSEFAPKIRLELGTSTYNFF